MENKVYQVITDRLLATIQSSGKLPWVKEWKAANNAPANGVSKRVYDPFGINFFMLSNAPYSNPYYLSYKQVDQLGGNVRKGEKGWPIVFWKINKYEKVNGRGETEEKTVPLLRYYTVFNVEQCENLTLEYVQAERANHNPIESAEKIIAGYENAPNMVIKESSRAFYVPSLDSVTMPLIGQFSSPEAYYSTFFHELGHSTGHSTRLNRKELTGHNPFGSHDYGVEELCAELTAAFLCAESGISNETIERNSAAYIKNWMNTIKANPEMFINAASRAGRAAKHILNIKKEIEVKEEEKEEVNA